MTKFLKVEERFAEFYLCDACGTRCYFCATNTFASLPCPNRCPYSSKEGVKIAPNWRKLENNKSKKAMPEN